MGVNQGEVKSLLGYLCFEVRSHSCDKVKLLDRFIKDIIPEKKAYNLK